MIKAIIQRIMRLWPRKSAYLPNETLPQLTVPERKPLWRRKIFWGGIVLVLLLIIFSWSDDGVKEQKPESTPPSETPAPQDESKNSEAACAFPKPWSYVSDQPLRTLTGVNLSPWNIVADPTVLYDKAKFRMWYTAADGRTNADGSGNGGIAYAESKDGLEWDVWRKSDSPVELIDLVLTTYPTDWDGAGVETASVLRTPSGEYRMYYTGNRPPEGSNHYSIGLATSDDGIHWKKYGNGPIFEPKNSWELPTCSRANDPRSCSNGGVLEPSVIYDSKEKIYKMWYAAVGTKDDLLTFRIGYATSADGIQWRRLPDPILDRGPSGAWNDYLVSHVNVIADPRSGYHLFYFGAKLSDYCEECGQRGHIGHAYSADGIRWQHNPQNPILSPSRHTWDEWTIGGPSVLAKDDELLLWFFAQKKRDSIESNLGFAKAVCR